jgi:hypothetical protein
MSLRFTSLARMKDNNTKYSLELFTRPEERILAVRGYLSTACMAFNTVLFLVIKNRYAKYKLKCKAG